MRFEDLNVGLLPGLDGSGRLFTEFVTALAPWTPPCLVSYPADAEWAISDYVEHIDQTLPNEESLLLIAESFSGPLALELLKRRSNIKALVLVASFARCPHPFLHLLPFIPVTVVKPFLQSTLALRTFCLDDHATTEQIDALKSAINQLPTNVLRCRLDLLRSLDIESKSIVDTLPILHLRADRDRLVRRSSAPDLSQLHPDSRVTTINGPHFLLQSRASECAKAIRDWVGLAGTVRG